jgi:hypothetical protein
MKIIFLFVTIFFLSSNVVGIFIFVCLLVFVMCYISLEPSF